jgi:predicted porin
MKKSLLAVAVAAALPAVAQAQSSVTLYGILDASIEYSNDEFNQLSATGGVVPGDDTLRMRSGIQSGSRFGVRGSEDLGGGLKAIFTIEHRLDVDTGNTAGGGFNSGNGTFWNGQAFVGLEGGWGQFTMGRQYSPIFWALISHDFAAYTLYNNWAAYTGNGFGPISGPQGPFRIDNSLYYKSPSFGGLTVHAMYALGENSTPGQSSGDFLGISANWRLGGLQIAAGYQSYDLNAGLESTMMVSASYAFTNFGLSVGYIAHEFVGAGNGDVDVIPVSAFLNIGPGRLTGNLLMVDTSGWTGRRNDSGLQWGLGYSVPMSKRTNWYVAFGMNDPSFLQAPTAQSIDGQMRVAVGLRHLF